MQYTPFLLFLCPRFEQILGGDVAGVVEEADEGSQVCRPPSCCCRRPGVLTTCAASLACLAKSWRMRVLTWPPSGVLHGQSEPPHNPRMPDPGTPLWPWLSPPTTGLPSHSRPTPHPPPPCLLQFKEGDKVFALTPGFFNTTPDGV